MEPPVASSQLSCRACSSPFCTQSLSPSRLRHRAGTSDGDGTPERVATAAERDGDDADSNEPDSARSEQLQPLSPRQVQSCGHVVCTACLVDRFIRQVADMGGDADGSMGVTVAPGAPLTEAQFLKFVSMQCVHAMPVVTMRARAALHCPRVPSHHHAYRSCV